MRYFTNTNDIFHTAVTRNLQVAIVLDKSLNVSIHLPGFVNCIVAEHCKDLTQIGPACTSRPCGESR